MPPQERPAKDAGPAIYMIQKHLGIKPTPLAKTSLAVENKTTSGPEKPESKMAMPRIYPIPLAKIPYYAEDKTAPTLENSQLKLSSPDEDDQVPGRYQGYGSRIPYAKFCDDYPYSRAFTETIKPRDQFVDVQSVPGVDLFGKDHTLNGAVIEEIIKVRVPGAEETKVVVMSRQKMACAPGVNHRGV